jgi:hypothetical protein
LIATHSADYQIFRQSEREVDHALRKIAPLALPPRFADTAMMESIKPMPKRRLRSEERRALAMLADAPFGYTGSILLVNGFKAPTLARLVRNGLATAETATARVGGGDPRIEIARLRITDAGRQALEGR